MPQTETKIRNYFIVYLLLYNNGLFVVALVKALFRLIDGHLAFSLSLGYQLVIFMYYFALLYGLLTGGKKVRWFLVSLLVLSILQFFYPPASMHWLPKMVPLILRILEICGALFFLVNKTARTALEQG